MKRLVLTHAEIQALSDFAYSSSRARTFELVRDTRNILHVRNQDGKLYRLTPEADNG